MSLRRAVSSRFGAEILGDVSRNQFQDAVEFRAGFDRSVLQTISQLLTFDFVRHAFSLCWRINTPPEFRWGRGRKNVFTMSIALRSPVARNHPMARTGTSDLLQGKSQTALFDERRDGQQQGRGNKSEYNVRQTPLLSSLKTEKQRGDDRWR